MLMQNFWVTNKEHYDMLWYFLEWSIVDLCPLLKVIIALSNMPRGFVPGQLEGLRPHFESIKQFYSCCVFFQWAGRK